MVCCMNSVSYEKELLVIRNYIEMERYTHAMERLAMVFQVSPNDAQLLYLEAYCLYQIGRYQEASDSCRASAGNGYDQADCYYLLSNISIQQKDYLEAERILLAALALKPQDPNYLAFHGYIKMLADDDYNALKLINKSLEIDPHNLEAMHYKFYFYLGSNESSDIKSRVIEEYFAISTDESDRFFKAGMLEYHKFHFAAAKENFIQAFQLDPCNKYIQKRLEELSRRPLFYQQVKYRVKRWYYKKLGFIRTIFKIKWIMLKHGGIPKHTLIVFLVPVICLGAVAIILVWLS